MTYRCGSSARKSSLNVRRMRHLASTAIHRLYRALQYVTRLSPGTGLYCSFLDSGASCSLDAGL
jgi:hypothetical protein